MSYSTLCHFVLVFFSLFSIAITSLGKERANLSAFRITDDNLKEDFTTRYSFCNRFSCFQGVKMAKNACNFLLLQNRGKIYAIF